MKIIEITPDHVKDLEYQCGEDLTDMDFRYNASTFCGFIWGHSDLNKYAPKYQQIFDESGMSISIRDVFEEDNEYYLFWSILCSTIPVYNKRFIDEYNRVMTHFGKSTL